jgi:GLPGLI family protein
MRNFGYALLIGMLNWANILHAQSGPFLSAGKIEYERKLNVYDMMNDWGDEDDGWNELMKKAVSKFRINYYNLSFNGEKTLFGPGRDNPDNDKSMMGWASSNVEDVTIYADLSTGLLTSRKSIYGKNYLIQDSIRKIKWKITDETRSIAGFNCRRANAMIMDSVYVVAFYTDEILAPGGPESFTGLPGMILGLALPHEHITWFATKVEISAPAPSEITPPTKGKKVTYAVLKEEMTDFVKDWRKRGQRILRQAML